MMYEQRDMMMTAIQGKQASDELLSEDNIKPCDNLDDIRKLDAELKLDPSLRQQLVNFKNLHMFIFVYLCILCFFSNYRQKSSMESEKQSFD